MDDLPPFQHLEFRLRLLKEGYAALEYNKEYMILSLHSFGHNVKVYFSESGYSYYLDGVIQPQSEDDILEYLKQQDKIHSVSSSSSMQESSQLLMSPIQYLNLKFLEAGFGFKYDKDIITVYLPYADKRVKVRCLQGAALYTSNTMVHPCSFVLLILWKVNKID